MANKSSVKTEPSSRVLEKRCNEGLPLGVAIKFLNYRFCYSPEQFVIFWVWALNHAHLTGFETLGGKHLFQNKWDNPSLPPKFSLKHVRVYK